ncbi:MAG: methylenetetrahydrofolate reductase [NAD(P)H] [Gammaproteobacteria bacterium]|nr:methylenetetrahydrofolate reductase [NAD(P)H] [Gammaproteobacteria bacterium]
MDSQKKFKPGFSCEFFPPKTEKGRASLAATIEELSKLGPGYFSCTYGAGGTTQEGTYETVRDIVARGFQAAPHITCIGSTRQKITNLLSSYQQLGINKIVALRGDLPEGSDTAGEFKYAHELVAFIRKQTGDHFHIEVAAYPEKHPEAVSLQQDIGNFKIKVDAGANAAITQYFFNRDAYFRFVDDCEASKIELPIVPGIMPITNYKQLMSFSQGCGAEIPRWILTRLEHFADDLSSIRAFGLEVVSELCAQLLAEGAPGLHFYTLNKSDSTVALWHNLGLTT